MKKKISSKKDRRIESRIHTTEHVVQFEMKDGSKTIPVPISNLSRLGMGVILDEKSNKKIGDEVSGILKIEAIEIPIAGIIRTQNETFCGVEFNWKNNNHFSTLRNLLTPYYIADSIYEVKTENLGADIEFCFIGQDFQCISYKSTQKNDGLIQFYINGLAFEFRGNKVTEIPKPLIRSTGLSDFFSNLTEYELEKVTKSKVERAMDSLKKVLQSWKNSPKIIKTIALQNL